MGDTMFCSLSVQETVNLIHHAIVDGVSPANVLIRILCRHHMVESVLFLFMKNIIIVPETD